MSINNFTAVILSYKRPGNIQRICETILEIKAVDKLILSNNNPEIDLTDYVSINDSRFFFIEQKEHCACIKRFEIAYSSPSKFYFCIDDDLFFNRNQIQYLMDVLVTDPSRPHGFWGQNYTVRGDKIRFHQPVVNKSTTIDILNRAYFFSWAHLVKLLNLVQLSQTYLTDVGTVDDIFLSFSGKKKPQLHNIDCFENCPTSNEKGIATWLRDDFEIKRIKALEFILKVRTRNDV